MFELHPKLEQDCTVVGAFDLSLLLLHQDSRYPWCILVPQQAELKEIHHLAESDRVQLMRESCCLAEVMTDIFGPDKMNIAVLGNIVPQLHMHHVARFEGDAAWPGPIWGSGEVVPYNLAQRQQRIAKLCSQLHGILGWQAVL